MSSSTPQVEGGSDRDDAAGRRTWLFPTLAGYQHTWIGPDVIAGLSAGAVVIPQGMAYATIANLPVQIGLYSCMIPMLVYAALGGSRAMSVSTTSTIATLTATTLVSASVTASTDDPQRNLMMLTLLVGAILLLARVLKLGSLVENINKPTTIGIQVGVGATVAVGQLPKLLGVSSNFSGHGFIRSLVAIGEALSGISWPTVALSAASIAALYFLKALLPRVPGPLVVVVAGILLVTLSGRQDPVVALIAKVPSGLPTPGLPSFEHVGAMLPGAFAIAIMAFLESAAVARGIRKAGERQIDSNQELMATGAASVAGSFFQTMPAAGGFSQSAVNQGAGARSQLSTLVTVVLAILTALFLGPVLSRLPQATLAAMVFVAVVGLIDVSGLARLARISPGDFWTAMATAVVGLSAGLLTAVAVGVAITLGRVLHELNRPQVSTGSRGPGALEVIVGPLYTANVLGTESEVLETVRVNRPLRVVVLNLGRMLVTSVTVLDALADLDRELEQTGVELRVAGVPEEAAVMARKTAWFQGMTEQGRVHDSVDSALDVEPEPRTGPPESQ